MFHFYQRGQTSAPATLLMSTLQSVPVPVANVLAEIRALTRDGVMPTTLISELHRRLEEVKDPLQGHTVVAMALIASAKGARKHARELMESVWWLDARALAPGTI